MTAKVNGLLLVALLISALLLVKSSYESRRLFAALDRARGEQRQLDIRHQLLESDRQKAATITRVEKVAREKLKMDTAPVAVTESVVDTKARDTKASDPKAKVVTP